MPISEDKKHLYPKDWKIISLRIRDRAEWICECYGECGNDHDGRCTAAHLQPHPITGSKVVLTTAHLNHQPEDVSDDNLRAFCQKCHLCYDKDHHARNRALTRKKAREKITLIESNS